MTITKFRIEAGTSLDGGIFSFISDFIYQCRIFPFKRLKLEYLLLLPNIQNSKFLLWYTVLCFTVQYCASQYSTVLHSTALCFTVQYCAVQHFASQYITVLHRTTLLFICRRTSDLFIEHLSSTQKMISFGRYEHIRACFSCLFLE